MSDKLTKVPLAKAGSGNTDWQRLRSMGDLEASANALDDSSTIIPTAQELVSVLPRAPTQSGARIEIRRDRKNQYRWSVLSANGTVLAIGPESFPSLRAARQAVKVMLSELGGIENLAA